MSEPGQASTTRAQQLRAEFDHAFGLAPVGDPGEQVDLLAIRCADHGFALPLSCVLSVLTDRRIVPVPSPSPTLLGLVGLRGLIAPVYDLRALLGYSGGVPARWVALLRAPAPFAVAFDHFERHLRVPAQDVIAAGASTATPHPFANGSVKTAAGPRPLIDSMALFEAVTGAGRRAGAPEREDLR
jgi:purine-binding chemotaxis protein CheW